MDAAVFLYDLFGDYLWQQVSQADLHADIVGAGRSTPQLSKIREVIFAGMDYTFL